MSNRIGYRHKGILPDLGYQEKLAASGYSTTMSHFSNPLVFALHQCPHGQWHLYRTSTGTGDSRRESDVSGS